MMMMMISFWRSNLSDKIKRDFFPAVLMSMLLYECTTWKLTKCIDKKLDENCSGMLRALLNKPWKQHLTKQNLYGHLPHVYKTIKVRRKKYVRHCWRSKNEIICDVLLWTPSHRCASVGWSRKTYRQQHCLIGLVSMFNSISTLVSYLMSKPFS